MWPRLEVVKASCWHRVSWVVLMSWWLDWSELKVYCGQGSLIAGTVCGRLSRREVGLVVRRGGLLEVV